MNEDLQQQIIKTLKLEQQHNYDSIVIISGAPEDYEDELRARHWFVDVLDELIAGLESGEYLFPLDPIKTALWRLEDLHQLSVVCSFERALIEPVQAEIQELIASSIASRLEQQFIAEK